MNLDHSPMNFNDYKYESETNNLKSRIDMCVRSVINYLGRSDLEGVNSRW
jgi:hypothetical protein